jgi:hypothetical protein
VPLKSKLKAQLETYEPAPGYGGTLNRQLLKRWIARCNRENLDNRLSALLKRITAPELIRVVVWAAHETRSVASRMHGFGGVDQKWKKLHSELTTNASMRNLQVLADAYKLHRDAYYAGCLGVLRRRDKDGRRLFWFIMGENLNIRFGRWFDPEVAILTEIVFDLSDVSPQHIKQARNQERPNRSWTVKVILRR